MKSLGRSGLLGGVSSQATLSWLTSLSAPPAALAPSLSLSEVTPEDPAAATQSLTPEPQVSLGLTSLPRAGLLCWASWSLHLPWAQSFPVQSPLCLLDPSTCSRLGVGTSASVSVGGNNFQGCGGDLLPGRVGLPGLSPEEPLQGRDAGELRKLGVPG